MTFFRTYPIFVPLIAGFLAESAKVIIYSLRNKKLCRDRFFHSGGMPSGHSALVGSLIFTVLLIEKDLRSANVTITFIFALIVMYDALNVRRQAGKHAQVLNRLQKKEKLDEVLGHTLPQVIAGFLLGMTTAVVLLGY